MKDPTQLEQLMIERERADTDESKSEATLLWMQQATLELGWLRREVDVLLSLSRL